MIHNYKQFILSLLFGAWTVTILAQTTPKPNYTLPDIETGATKAYVARDFVKLEPGFDYAASSSTTFNARIDAGLLFPPTVNTYATSTGSITPDPTQGYIVGSIPGSASVTPTGAATYQIPIEVPQGINGMQPQVSIVYNSQGGFGALGTDWDISGGSVITCGVKNMYFDGKNDGIKLDNTDPLYLDGQRLILLSGSPYTAGAVYGTEIENYARVTVAAGGSYWPSNIYFIVTTKDGKTMEYGNSSTSLVTNSQNVNDNKTLAWKMNKVTDTFGNLMIYTYSDYGQYLQRIDYAGQSIEFAYNQIMDVPKKSFINNFVVTHAKLLSSITTKSGAIILKTVGFTYTSTSDNRLNNVSETASDNTILNSTTINWGAESTITTQNVGSNNDPNLIPNKGFIYTGDVNGDGYADRIELWPGSSSGGDGDRGHVIVYLFDPLTHTFQNSASASLFFSYSDNVNVPRSGIAQTSLAISDINNDGKDEISIANDNFIYCFSYTNNQLIQIGNRQSLILNPSYTYNEIKTDRYNRIFTANVNGDQFNDIVCPYNYSSYDLIGQYLGSVVGYRLFTGSSTGLNTRTDETKNDYYYSTYQIGDFNADGKVDVFGIPDDTNFYDIIDGDVSVYADGKWNSATNTRLQRTGDFNGDGLSDILVQKNDLSWHLLLNNGVNKAPTDQVIPQFPNVSDATGQDPILIDYNGDGQLDVVIGDETWNYGLFEYTTWYFFKNTNGNFTLDYQEVTYARMAYYTADVNGDGITDLIVSDYKDMGSYYWVYPCPGNGGSTANAMAPAINPGGPDCQPYQVGEANYQNIFTAFIMPDANRRNRVTAITNGMQQKNEFTYTNFSTYQPYDASEADQTVKIRDLKAPITVVNTQTNPDQSVTTYTFEKPKYHTEGKGFLGFTTVTSTDTQKNAKVTSNFDINQTYFFPILTSQHISTVTGTDDVSVSSQTNDVKVIDTANKRYIPIVIQQTSTDVLKGITQSSTADYTNYPSSLIQTTTVGNLTTTVATTYTGPTGKTPFLPFTVITTRTQDGQSASRSTNYGYVYDNSYGGNPYKITQTTETTDLGDPNQVLTTTTIDNWGHAQTVSVAANGQTRGSSVGYTASGRFLASKTNVLGEITNYDWGDETLGLLNSETTSLGGTNRTTSYTYNDWGQLVETKYPDGIRKANVLQWAGSNGVSGAVYYTYSQTSGTAPVTVWYDGLGREIQKDTYGLNNKKVSVSTEYYTDDDLSTGKRKGMVYRTSEPYFDGDTKIWNKTYTYDEFGRPTKVVTPIGDVVTQFNGLTTTITTPEGTNETTLNSAGQTITSKINDKSVTYVYYASGLIKTSTPEGGQPVTQVYNLQGKRIKLNDPDGGFIRNEYNGFGELTKEVQLIHLNKDSIITLNNYDNFGRLLSINRNSEITNYNFDTNEKSRVNSIEISGKNKQTFGFDELDRVNKITEDIISNGVTRTYITAKEYDALGRIKKEIYPSGYYTVNTYDQYSNLTEVKDNVNRSIWKADSENALGQAISIYKGTNKTTYGYDPINHQVTSIYAAGVVDYTYGYFSNNNLQWRSDNKTTQREDFGYDDLNRLTSWTVTNSGTQTPYGITYDPVNPVNIQTKSGIETDPDHLLTMYYGGKNPNGTTTGRLDGSPIGPHALSTISGVPASPFPQTDLTVTYTDFKKIATLHDGTKDYELTYGVDDQRRMSVYYANGKSLGATLTRYYVGNYEEEVSVDGKVRKIHYLSGAILIQHDGIADSLLYTYSDAQGSLIALTDADGNLVRRYAYDPWGVRRDADNWNAKDNGVNLIVNRGYTGHEHLDAFGIINMNGRVYDPATGMFFSPDPYIQSPGDWLNYNRYSYCFGNPLRYTDPTGLITWNDIISGIAIVAGVFLLPVPFVGEALIVAGATHFGGTFVDYMNSNHNGNPKTWDQASNEWGFKFSDTIGINGETQKEKNYANSLETSNPSEEKPENSYDRDTKVNNSEGNNDLVNSEKNYGGANGLTKYSYSAFDEMRGDKKWGGVLISLSYMSMQSNGSRWMQSWTSDYTAGGVIETGRDDPDTHNGDYYTHEELQDRTHGNTVSFYDRPASPYSNDFPSTFTKFTLILVNSYNQMILKLYYGYFTNQNGTIAFPLTVGYHKY